MRQPVRDVFVDLVASCKPGHFQTCDMILLVRYCEAAVVAAQAEQCLAAEGAVVNGKVNPWAIVLEKATRTLTALSMRLRVSPQARSANIPTRQPQQPISYYERMNLEADDAAN
jgi:phage terminase small subunit